MLVTKKGKHELIRTCCCVSNDGSVFLKKLNFRTKFIFVQHDWVIPLGLFTKGFDREGYVNSNILKIYYRLYSGFNLPETKKFYRANTDEYTEPAS